MEQELESSPNTAWTVGTDGQGEDVASVDGK